MTKGGIPCQAWASQFPHTHNDLPATYPDAGLDANYCRNPLNGFSGPWCFTIDTSKRWDYLGTTALWTPVPSHRRRRHLAPHRRRRANCWYSHSVRRKMALKPALVADEPSLQVALTLALARPRRR